MKKKSKVGLYCRVSTLDQDKGMDSQERALREYCHNQGFSNWTWYRDKLSGANTNRPAFKKLQKAIFEGRIKVVVCWKLDRLSRSLKDGVDLLYKWLDSGVRIISVTEQFDLNGTMGQMMASFLFGVAQMGREGMRENIKRGLIAAKARGTKLGRRPKLFAKDIVPLLKKGLSVIEVAEKLGKTRQAIYDCLKRENIGLNDMKES